MTLGTGPLGQFTVGDVPTDAVASITGTVSVVLQPATVAGVGARGVMGTASITNTSATVSGAGQQNVIKPSYIAFAFSNQPVPPSLPPEPVIFYANSAGDIQLDLNINPVVISVLSLQSDSVAPPIPGVQLSFFWG